LKSIEKVIEHIGKVVFVKFPTSKKIKIIIKPNSSVKVTLPLSVSYLEAERFVIEKKEWIVNSLNKFKEKQQSQFIYNDSVKNITKFHDLVLTKNLRHNFYISVKKNVITVSYPEELNISDIRLQKAINKGIEIALKKEAVEYIFNRINYLSEKTGIKFNELKISTAKSKWGSCTSQNNINISANVMRLPEHLIDYILLHELAHVNEKNHGHNFWVLLNKLTGNARGLDKELKNYKIPKF